MELRLAMIKRQVSSQYGEESAMTFLKMLSDWFGCNWSLLVGVFNKDVKIVNNVSETTRRKKQSIILMGHLYDETRYHIANHYLNMSVNYLYQLKEEHSPEIFATEQWLSLLDEEVVACGVRSYAIEAKRFLISFDAFMGAFK